MTQEEHSNICTTGSVKELRSVLFNQLDRGDIKGASLEDRTLSVRAAGHIISSVFMDMKYQKEIKSGVIKKIEMMEAA